MKQQVYLLPGFFGFANLGDFTYFSHVQEYLQRALAELGVDADLVPVQTEPTASLKDRAGRLLEVMVRSEASSAPIHLIGHSTGGLDARLLLTPGVSLKSNMDIEPYAQRVKSLVSVSTPHYGSPMASFFSSLFGEKLLLALSLCTIYIIRFGHLPRSALFKLVGLISHVDDLVGLKNNLLDQLYDQLLADFSEDRRLQLARFLEQVRADQTLITQLTPEGIDLFNAATGDRKGVRYGSVVNRARSPGIGSTLAVGLDPYAQATHALYRGLYFLASRMPDTRLPQLSAQQGSTLWKSFGELPAPGDNDGIVPTRSQVWGDLIHAVEGDHLDLIGHFNGPDHDPPHTDWLATGSGFSRERFEALWTDVAKFIAESDYSFAR